MWNLFAVYEVLPPMIYADIAGLIGCIIGLWGIAGMIRTNFQKGLPLKSPNPRTKAGREGAPWKHILFVCLVLISLFVVSSPVRILIALAILVVFYGMMGYVKKKDTVGQYKEELQTWKKESWKMWLYVVGVTLVWEMHWQEFFDIVYTPSLEKSVIDVVCIVLVCVTIGDLFFRVWKNYQKGETLTTEVSGNGVLVILLLSVLSTSKVLRVVLCFGVCLIFLAALLYLRHKNTEERYKEEIQELQKDLQNLCLVLVFFVVIFWALTYW